MGKSQPISFKINFHQYLSILLLQIDHKNKTKDFVELINFNLLSGRFSNLCNHFQDINI